MNKKQKMIKLTAKRAKARKNKHTAPTIKKYISKSDRAKMLAQEEADSALTTTADKNPASNKIDATESDVETQTK
ncbi:DUF2986 domain-containing protein [Shewanella psychropiezotolerans]|uniref:DUF2986 domain-containing protein n=1 Tax=Shewanella psychropiezotolerans TaxID=2593655 RepID=A0ABX5WXG8_9GAMM|nr:MULTISPECIES: DUF2986 domain-containing protein [Shewanella]MPY26568.1 DUF2986 domain-containing protein [Shewanella sp. YLB-07]QDO83769.1 DUF2986 domain-containing protein [Shewanella psychropiezotolerans]